MEVIVVVRSMGDDGAVSACRSSGGLHPDTRRSFAGENKLALRPRREGDLVGDHAPADDTFVTQHRADGFFRTGDVEAVVGEIEGETMRERRRLGREHGRSLRAGQITTGRLRGPAAQTAEEFHERPHDHNQHSAPQSERHPSRSAASRGRTRVKFDVRGRWHRGRSSRLRNGAGPWGRWSGALRGGANDAEAVVGVAAAGVVAIALRRA